MGQTYLPLHLYGIVQIDGHDDAHSAGFTTSSHSVQVTFAHPAGVLTKKVKAGERNFLLKIHMTEADANKKLKLTDAAVR